ncbi:tumor necrosis factor receptor superfamily member 6B [Esox lucius]|uniref:TNFR-Cys domain-containing protein n=1 Tax=Esox lucius TaxID=8010 RepID=A0AAY5KLE3_ESOLU|nr:tumor necrosis factor receptor superfamily member 6B [Esox lucius]
MHLLADSFLAFVVFTFCGGNPPEPATSPTYMWRDHETGDSVICDKCAPGNYLIKHCTKYSKSICGPCPTSHYTEVWNYIERCQYCSRFCTNEEIESVPCTPLHNRECECKDGFYLKYGSCLKHSRCRPGEGVITNGTAHTDVECEPCAGGFFSNESSSSKACQSFSVCAPGYTTIPGNEMNDVYCSLCKNGSRTAEDEAVCDRELQEFLAMQILPPRKHKRLVTVLRRGVGKNSTKNQSVSELLTTLRTKPIKPFAVHVVDIMNTEGLLHLRSKIIKWFPHIVL